MSFRRPRVSALVCLRVSKGGWGVREESRNMMRSKSILSDIDFGFSIAGRKIGCVQYALTGLKADDLAELFRHANADITRGRANNRRTAAGAFAFEHDAADDGLIGGSRLRQFHGVIARASGLCGCCRDCNDACGYCKRAAKCAEARESQIFRERRGS